MTLRPENKKSAYALMILGPLALFSIYYNLTPAARPPAAPRGADTPLAPPSDTTEPNISRPTGSAARRPSSRGKNGEFRPVLKSKKKEDQPVEPWQIDPTIRFDLLAKVNSVPAAGGLRDLFQISKAPPVKMDLKASNEPVIIPFRDQGPRQPPPPPPPQPTPGPPPPEPITLRYYGCIVQRSDGKRQAYFLDGDEVMMAIEGDTLKGRYLIVQIAPEKVLVEDKVQKRRQSLNIEPEAISG